MREGRGFFKRVEGIFFLLRPRQASRPNRRYFTASIFFLISRCATLFRPSPRRFFPAPFASSFSTFIAKQRVLRSERSEVLVVAIARWGPLAKPHVTAVRPFWLLPRHVQFWSIDLRVGDVGLSRQRGRGLVGRAVRVGSARDRGDGGKRRG